MPASVPVKSLYLPPIATMSPLLFKSTLHPNSSSTSGPSMSAPNCDQLPPLNSKILTCPDLLPLSSLSYAPIATVRPSPLMATAPE